MTEEMGEDEETKFFVYQESLVERLCMAAGWALGWTSYFLARLGFIGQADRLADTAIVLRRDNPGAVRAIGYLNGLRGLPAIRRGQFLVTGKIHETGPFANKGYYATYHVAAPNKMRALALIKRFEWDAIPDSLQIEEGELDYPDSGAEGVLWVQPGRTFFSEGD